MGLLEQLPAGSLAGGNKGSGIGGIMGGFGDTPANGGGGSSQGGFAALPPEVQKAYLEQYLPQIMEQNKGKFQTTPLGQAENGPFSSQALQELQQYSNQNGGIFGNGTGVKPLGAVEPFNPMQQQALSGFGGGLAGLQQDLPGYQNLYNQNVLNPVLAEIQRQQDIAQNQLLGGKAGGGNLGALGSSALGQQLAGLQEQANRFREQAGAKGFESSLGLRRQTLADMLKSGTLQQGQNQQYLNAIQPQLQQTTPGARTAQFGQQLAGFPGSQAQSYTGPSPAQPGMGANLINMLGMGQGIMSAFGGQGGQGMNTGNVASMFGGQGNQGGMPQGGSNWMMGSPPASGRYNLGGFNVF